MKRLLRAFMFSCVLAMVSLFSVSLFWKSPLELTWILIAVSILMLLVWKSRDDTITFFICGIAGALSESLAIAFGAWTYAFPSIIGIPFWLPFLWGIAALFMKRISFEVHDFINSGNKHSLEEIRAKVK